MKTCTRCRTAKEDTHFARAKGGLRAHCRDCTSVEGKAYREKNRERLSVKTRVIDGPGRGRWGARTDPDLPSVLSEEERQVIIGSLLGDGSLTFGGRAVTPVFRERHGPTQEDYLRWKGALLGRLKPMVAPHASKIRGVAYPGWYLSTPANPALHEFTDFYAERKKVVPVKFVEELGPLGLAVWLQDDGNLCLSSSGNPYMWICSEGFTPEENERLADRLRTLTQNLGVSIGKARGGSGVRIYIGVSAMRDVARLTTPHWHPSMAYKFPYPALLSDPEVAF